MLSQLDLESLVAGKLSDKDAREILLRLQPDYVAFDEFAHLVHTLSESADERYLPLRNYAAQSMDCCGTGGSGLPRFNTSTAVAFVLAAAKVKIAKFGNRAASGRSGSFDVLEKLGIPVQSDASHAELLLDRCNLVFLFAPQVYPALARLAPVRKALGVKTVLNFVGPLLNPVHPTRRLVGVSDPAMKVNIANYLSCKTSTDFACVVRASCGLDEYCPGCGADVCTVGSLRPTAIPGLPASGRDVAHSKSGENCPHQEMTGATAEENAKRMIAIFAGEDTDSPAYKLTCLNAALALVVAGRAENLEDGKASVQALLRTGAVQKQLEKVKEHYAKLAT